MKSVAVLAPADPYQTAELLGIEVARCPMMRAQGMWLPDARTVILADRLTPVQERCALAHQMSHVVLGHDGVPSPRDEWQADRFTATHMVRLDEFGYWFGRCGTLDDLAFELGVTPKIALAFAGIVTPETVRELAA